MVNADGDFVIAKPDKASWELYQEKAKASAAAAAEAAAAEESKALQARGLECPVDKRMFLEPTKTPCCQRTYCNDCISNALIESDFVCPGCSTEGVLLDNLTPDDEAVAKIKAFEAEKAEAKKEKEKQALVSEENTANAAPDQDPSKDPKEQSPSQSLDNEDASSQSKKRPAESEPGATGGSPEADNAAAKKQKTDEAQDQHNQPQMMGGDNQASQMPMNANVPLGAFNGMPPFSNPGFGNDPMGFMNPMAMAGGFPNPMGQGWNPMNMPFNPMQPGMFGDQSNGFPNMFNGDPSMNMFPMAQMAAQMQNPGFQNQAMGNFSNQQRTSFGGPYSREEDSPYFRQPVNPQRHQARHRRVRPSDYREL